MTYKKTNSVRKFLLSSILATLLLVSALSGLASWLNAKEEMDELYNKNLIQIANVIDSQHTVMTSAVYTKISNEKKITGEEDYYVRIRDNRGKTLYSSHPSIDLPRLDKAGYSKIFYQNHRWRLFSKRSEKDNAFIEVAQITDMRATTIAEATWILLIPQILTIPLLSLLIWLIVGQGLKPLDVLSRTISQRKESLLAPIALDKAPAEIQPLVIALNDMLRRLGDIVSVLKQFTADAAHELRTPLTALKLQLVVLEQAKTAIEREQAIDELKSGIERSISLVHQLLTMAQMEPDSYEAVLTSVNLPEIARQSINHLIIKANDKKIDLGLEKWCDAPITGDKEALGILLNNLLENAIRYTPEHGTVNVNISKNNQQTILEVADSGPGIPHYEQSRVFDRFYRGRGVTEPGNGLGLAIVKEIAKRHDCEILLGQSEELKGLSIKLIFTPGSKRI